MMSLKTTKLFFVTINCFSFGTSMISHRMKRIFILVSCILTGFLFDSCSTDFSVEAPYKETMVIYGLLNPDTMNGKVQYIRISKAYLGEGNALIMAQERDSVNYADILDVNLERIDANGNGTFPCL